MQQKKFRSIGVLSSLLLALPIVLFASSLILALAMPQDSRLNGLNATPIPSTTTAAPQRSDLAPPATRMGLTLATPDYATNVPQALTDNFDLQQFALGRRTYTQWCATCHGDRGQGLALWRSAWNEADQNCTRSGCHGVRHAPDGFTMLAVPPPLIGPNTLTKFTNALQLFGFIRAAMPFQAPGSLSDTEYWAVTAFLADQHSADAAGQALNEQTAPGVLLHQ
jgi:mono/diheme cytochrome c family protein